MQKVHAIKPSLAVLIHTKIYFNQTIWFIPSSETLSGKNKKTKDKIAGNVTLVFYKLDITVL